MDPLNTRVILKSSCQNRVNWGCRLDPPWLLIVFLTECVHYSDDISCLCSGYPLRVLIKVRLLTVFLSISIFFLFSLPIRRLKTKTDQIWLTSSSNLGIGGTAARQRNEFGPV